MLSFLYEETADQVRALWRIPILEVAKALQLPLTKDGNEYRTSRFHFGREYTAHINELTNDWYCTADEEFPHSFLGIRSTIDLVLFSEEGLYSNDAEAFLLEKFPAYRIQE